MKSEILNLRIPALLKEKLVEEADLDCLKVSELARDILMCYFKMNEGYSLFAEKEIDFYNSSDFTYLITWMYEKRFDNYDTSSVQAFEGLKKIAMKAINYDGFRPELKKEFEKVYVDLTRFIYEYGMPNNCFLFCIPYQPQSFNYSLLVDFIFQKPFENTYYY